jgi:alkylhydroperoxidase family enzyme
VYGSDVLDDRLERLDDADISPGARAMLPVLERFSLNHEELGADDLAGVRELGVGDEAIVDAFYVAYLFNIINRMADALRFEIGTQADFDKSTKSLLGRGYK